MTTITEMDFNIILTYQGLNESAFDEDINAQQGTIDVLSLSISNVDPEQIVIESSEPSERRLVAADAATTVNYRVQTTIELLGFSSLSSQDAYDYLVVELTKAISSGSIIRELKKRGIPMYNTPLFDSDNFMISRFAFSPPITKFIQTAVPTVMPTLNPTLFIELITEQETYLSLTIVGFVLLIVLFSLFFWYIWKRPLSKDGPEKKYGVKDVENVKAENIPRTASGRLSPASSPATLLPGSALEKDELDMLPFGAQLSSVLETNNRIEPDKTLENSRNTTSTNEKSIGDGDLDEGGSIMDLPTPATQRTLLPPIFSPDHLQRGPGFSKNDPGPLRNSRVAAASSFQDMDDRSELAVDHFRWDPGFAFEKRDNDLDKNRSDKRNARRRNRQSAKIIPTLDPSPERPDPSSEQRGSPKNAVRPRRKHGARGRLPGPGEAANNDSDPDHDKLPTILLSPLKKKGNGPGFK
jgi:hypothetical protein